MSLVLFGFKCNSDGPSQTNNLKSSQATEYKPNQETKSEPSQATKLSPNEWLAQYKKAFNECNNQVPIMVPDSTKYTNFNQWSEDATKMTLERGKILDDLLKKKYPELCSYLDIPKYKALWSAQAAISQQKLDDSINQIQEETQREHDESERELMQQAIRDQQELDFQKEQNERFLKDHPAPQFIP